MSRSYWLRGQIKELNEDIPFDERKKIYYSHKKQAQELQAEWNLRSQIAQTKEQQTQILSKHDWFETNETCQKCSFLTGAFTAKRELVEEQKWLDDAAGKIDEDNRLLTSSNFLEEEKDYENYSREKTALQSKLENLDVVSENIKLQLELEANKLTTFENEKKVYSKNEVALSNNIKIKERINKVDTKIIRLEQNLQHNNDELTKDNSYLGQISQKITDLGGNIEMLKEIEKKYALHELLMDAFSNDGIPLMIMNRAVPLINNEIKKVLSNITNFEVFLEVDTEAHDLMIFIDDGTSRRRIELGSGMEKTLTALTIRSALSNISLLPTCNLFVIDEGFGTLDSENINHMNMLLGYLKSKFENVLIISHIESMQDITNNVININKNEKGYSNIKIL